jgi:alcohol dehydrogenase (cytochrome c)
MLRKKSAVIATAAVVCLLAGATRFFPPLQWRWAALAHKLSGEVPEIPLPDFVRWLAPRSPVNLYQLAALPNVHAAVTNEQHSVAAAASGGPLYARHCATCHGAAAQGAAGPSLVAALRAGLTDWAFFQATRWGRSGTPMATQPLAATEIWQVHSFVRSLAQRDSGVGEDNEADAKLAGLPFESIRDASARPGEWLTYAGSYAGHRHSRLTSISKANVGRLQVAWVAQLRGADAFLEASPIVHAGRMYVTESPEGVVALDAASGELLWRFRRPLPNGVLLCCGSPNRGVAMLGDSLFVQTLDAHLVSLDAATGDKRWEVKVADFRQGYSMTGAPLALRDKVVVGVSGSSFGARGFVAAFRAHDGRRLWTFNTVPAPGEAGNESWAADSWKTGGAATWATGAYDAATGTLYWGVGNPGPSYHASARAGKNLYSNSVVALDENTGGLRWHYQFTPSDDHAWDSSQQPVIADLPSTAGPRSALLWANRNGFYYVLERRSGRFILAKPFVKQTWNDGFSADGAPLMRPDARASAQGTLVWPWVGGGTNWWSPSFDARRGLLLVPTVDAASLYFEKAERYAQGRPFLGGASHVSASHPVTVAIKAIEAATGEVRWETALARGTANLHHSVGGILTTASGLAFTGYRDEILVLDSDTGAVLRRLRTGGVINAAPVAYEIGGRQYVAVMAGRSLFALSIPE